jgi:DNA-binding transcriptional regulator YiaG
MTPTDLRAARALLDMTQAQLAAALKLKGVNPARTIGAWERGRHPITGPAQVAIQCMLRERGLALRALAEER